MYLNPIQKLYMRVGHMRAQAKYADNADVRFLQGFAVINPHLVTCGRKNAAYNGNYARLENRRLQAHARTCRKYARALTKLARSYVYRPGKTEAELKAVS